MADDGRIKYFVVARRDGWEAQRDGGERVCAPTYVELRAKIGSAVRARGGPDARFALYAGPPAPAEDAAVARVRAGGGT